MAGHRQDQISQTPYAYAAAWSVPCAHKTRDQDPANRTNYGRQGRRPFASNASCAAARFSASSRFTHWPSCRSLSKGGQGGHGASTLSGPLVSRASRLHPWTAAPTFSPVGQISHTSRRCVDIAEQYSGPIQVLAGMGSPPTRCARRGDIQLSKNAGAPVNSSRNIAVACDGTLDHGQGLLEAERDRQCFRAVRFETRRRPISDRSAHPARARRPPHHPATAAPVTWHSAPRTSNRSSMAAIA